MQYTLEYVFLLVVGRMLHEDDVSHDTARLPPYVSKRQTPDCVAVSFSSNTRVYEGMHLLVSCWSRPSLCSASGYHVLIGSTLTRSAPAFQGPIAEPR